MRDVVKKEDCIRCLLLRNFVDYNVESLLPLHNCCNRCHRICKCGDGECREAIPEFDKVEEEFTAICSGEAGRIVTEEDKDCKGSSN